MSKAVLIAGDKDFNSVVERLVDFGSDIQVISHRKSYFKELAWAADSHHLVDFEDYYGWSTGALKSGERVRTVFGPSREVSDRTVARFISCPATSSGSLGVYRRRCLRSHSLSLTERMPAGIVSDISKR